MTHLEACKDAAAALGVNVRGPATVQLPSGSELVADLLVEHFGAPAGTLVFSDADACWPHKQALRDLGYAASSYAEPTQPMECSDLREMLLEWTWCGSEAQRPSWA
jgi:hypothetical protein